MDMWYTRNSSVWRSEWRHQASSVPQCECGVDGTFIHNSLAVFCKIFFSWRTSNAGTGTMLGSSWLNPGQVVPELKTFGPLQPAVVGILGIGQAICHSREQISVYWALDSLRESMFLESGSRSELQMDCKVRSTRKSIPRKIDLQSNILITTTLWFP